MHEHEWFFCNTVNPRIIAKFADPEKNIIGLKLVGPIGAGALEAHHGPWPVGGAGCRPGRSG